MRHPDIKLILAIPGILMVFFGYVGCRLLNIPLADTSPEIALFASLTAFFLAMATSVLFEQHVPSFRLAGGYLEGIVGRLALTPLWALALSLTSGIGEELFFRGLLLGLFGDFLPIWFAVLAQAVLFAAFHPAPRAAWGYTLWTGIIGVLFGVVTVASGSIIPTILAHYLFNHLNFEAALQKPA
ncbi:MAG: CPBP family intramembrane glutamic endopeptidase [Deinococcales bacterium]